MLRLWEIRLRHGPKLLYVGQCKRWVQSVIVLSVCTTMFQERGVARIRDRCWTDAFALSWHCMSVRSFGSADCRLVTCAAGECINETPVIVQWPCKHAGIRRWLGGFTCLQASMCGIASSSFRLCRIAGATGFRDAVHGTDNPPVCISNSLRIAVTRCQYLY